MLPTAAALPHFSAGSLAHAAAIYRSWALRLGHAPEERQRALDDTADIAAPGLVAEVEAGRHVDDMLHGCLVEACDGRLLLRQVLGRKPGRHLFFHRGAVGPAEPGLLAGATHGNVGGRVGAVAAGVPGVEHAPAALAGRRFRGAALADGAPVGGDEVHRYAELLEQVSGHLAHGLERRLVLGDEAGDGLAGIARFRQQLLGAFNVALAL